MKARDPLIPVMLLVLVAGCGGTGMGSGVRADVAERMQTRADPIAACYQAALKRDRKLRGRMTVQATAEPRTGQFVDVQVVQDDLRDPDLTRCVVEQVATLELAQPQDAKVAITYPLDFAPSN